MHFTWHEVSHAMWNDFAQPESPAVLSDLENFLVNQVVYEEMGAYCDWPGALLSLTWLRVKAKSGSLEVFLVPRSLSILRGSREQTAHAWYMGISVLLLKAEGDGRATALPSLRKSMTVGREDIKCNKLSPVKDGTLIYQWFLFWLKTQYPSLCVLSQSSPLYVYEFYPRTFYMSCLWVLFQFHSSALSVYEFSVVGFNQPQMKTTEWKKKKLHLYWTFAGIENGLCFLNNTAA